MDPHGKTKKLTTGLSLKPISFDQKDITEMNKTTSTSLTNSPKLLNKEESLSSSNHPLLISCNPYKLNIKYVQKSDWLQRPTFWDIRKNDLFIDEDHNKNNNNKLNHQQNDSLEENDVISGDSSFNGVQLSSMDSSIDSSGESTNNNYNNTSSQQPSDIQDDQRKNYHSSPHPRYKANGFNLFAQISDQTNNISNRNSTGKSFEDNPILSTLNQKYDHYDGTVQNDNSTWRQNSFPRSNILSESSPTRHQQYERNGTMLSPSLRRRHYHDNQEQGERGGYHGNHNNNMYGDMTMMSMTTRGKHFILINDNGEPLDFAVIQRWIDSLPESTL